MTESAPAGSAAEVRREFHKSVSALFDGTLCVARLPWDEPLPLEQRTIHKVIELLYVAQSLLNRTEILEDLADAFRTEPHGMIPASNLKSMHEAAIVECKSFLTAVLSKDREYFAATEIEASIRQSIESDIDRCVDQGDEDGLFRLLEHNGVYEETVKHEFFYFQRSEFPLLTANDSSIGFLRRALHSELQYCLRLFVEEKAVSETEGITVGEAARLLGIHSGTVSRLVGSGVLLSNGKNKKERRITKSSALDYLSERLRKSATN